MEDKKIKKDVTEENDVNVSEETVAEENDENTSKTSETETEGKSENDSEINQEASSDNKLEEDNSKDSAIKNDDNNDDESEDKEDASDKKKKKKHFKKKKDPKDEMIEELNDKYQRLFAEFQNYRNRSEKEKSSMFDMGARNIIEKILPVADNFERGIAALSEEDLESPVGQGMDMIYKQMLKTLEDIGVEVIEAEGKEFNPELHNAVMQVENEELEENTVAAELQKGYTYKGVVIRHSMVSVVTK